MGTPHPSPPRRTARALLLALLGCTGCHTTLQAIGPDGPAIAGGLRLWLDCVDLEQPPGESPLVLIPGFLWMAADLPLSLAADAALLPWSVLNELRARGIDVKPPWR